MNSILAKNKLKKQIQESCNKYLPEEDGVMFLLEEFSSLTLFNSVSKSA